MLPFVVSSVGIVCGFLIIFVNGFLIYKFRHEQHHRINDMAQFFYRFHLDVLIGIATILYLGHVLTYYILPEKVFNDTKILVLWFGLAVSNLQMARMFFQLFISCDRLTAAFFPISYRIYHNRIPTFFIFTISLGTGLFQDFIFFYCCDFVILVPDNCLALGCVMNKCFKNFWSTYQTVILSVIVAFSICFCTRLFWWSKNTSSLSQANRLAILDAVTTFIFQFIPPFCVSLWPEFILFNFSFAGPFNLVGKLVGSSIESVLMLRVLKRNQKTTMAVVTLDHVKTSNNNTGENKTTHF